MKLQVADVFLDKFQLKPDEVKALRGNRDGSLSQVSNQLFYWVTMLHVPVHMYITEFTTCICHFYPSLFLAPLYKKINFNLITLLQ